MMKALTFTGGTHPSEYKELTEDKPFELMPLPEKVLLPTSQHIGKPARLSVKKKSEVKTGQVIAEQDGFISSIIHSSVNGTVKNIGIQANVSGFPREAIEITVDGNGEELCLMEAMNPDKVTPDEIRQRVKEAGIVGQGGAAFPTYVKLTPPEGAKIDCVILNGAECEPYLTRDYRFMLERTEAVIGGLNLIMKALGVKKGAAGIEDNKPKAIEKMTKMAENYPEIDVYQLKTKYPQGAEKMLIKAILGREVPPGKLPLDVGVVIQNIGTAVAVYDAVVKGIPETTAALTVSGGAVKEPKNLIVPVGTPINDVIEFCGGFSEDVAKVVVGGPMMGVAQYDFTAPVMKATSGILALTKSELNKVEETNCVSCGKCVEACALNVLPTTVVKMIKEGRLEEADKLGIMTCMECGTCTYVCPANIPLVQWIRLGKHRVAAFNRAKQENN